MQAINVSLQAYNEAFLACFAIKKTRNEALLAGKGLEIAAEYQGKAASGADRRRRLAAGRKNRLPHMRNVLSA